VRLDRPEMSVRASLLWMPRLRPTDVRIAPSLIGPTRHQEHCHRLSSRRASTCFFSQ
jgi:hypothetical protein